MENKTSFIALEVVVSRYTIIITISDMCLTIGVIVSGKSYRPYDDKSKLNSKLQCYYLIVFFTVFVGRSLYYDEKKINNTLIMID